MKRLAALAGMTVLLFAAAEIRAASFAVVHYFDPSGGYGGVNTYGKLLLSSNTLYGLTYGGSSGADGSLYRVNTDGTGFSTLVEFFGFIDVPTGTLLLANDALFGEIEIGNGRDGSVFTVDTGGSTLSDLHDFTTPDGTHPSGALLLSGDLLYGTTTSGGAFGHGSVFALGTDGTFFSNLQSFPTGSGGTVGDAEALLLSGTNLYGTTKYGGPENLGVVFALSTDGSGFTNLHTFSGVDGSSPDAGLVLCGNTLYGVTEAGGTSNNGTLFKLLTDGSGFTNLYNFDFPPSGALVCSGNLLYGTTPTGGALGQGAVFALGLDGTGFTNLYSFDGTNGASPTEALLYSGGTLYGTTTSGGGGTPSYGVLYALRVARPSLQIALAGDTVVLTWPDPAFALQAAPSPSGVFTNVPGAFSPYTNAVSGRQRFFRLGQ